jgi:hypothetical protein
VCGGRPGSASGCVKHLFVSVQRPVAAPQGAASWVGGWVGSYRTPRAGSQYFVVTAPILAVRPELAREVVISTHRPPLPVGVFPVVAWLCILFPYHLPLRWLWQHTAEPGEPHLRWAVLVFAPSL